MSSSLPVTTSFLLALPKVELHAHLTGSISPQTLHEIWQQQRGTTQLIDPLIALAPPEGQAHHNILTFFKLFDTYIYALCNTPESIYYATTAVLQDFVADGVRYLELRTTPRESLSRGLTKEIYIETVLSAIDSFHHLEAAKSENDVRMKVSLILSIDRQDSSAQVNRTVDLAFQYRNRGIVALDLCGNPLIPLDHEILLPAFQRAKSAGLPLTLHFAETPESSAETELLFLLNMKPQRIGHVIHLSPSIEEIIQQRCVQGELGLELCMSCNVLAKMLPEGEKSEYRHHHFGKWYRRQGVGIGLCTDDVGVFGKKVSEEYGIVAEHFGLGREGLVEVVRRSVGIIFGGEEEKVRLRSLIEEFERREGL